MHASAHMRVCMCMHVCVFVYDYVCVCVCVCVFYVCMFVSVSVHGCFNIQTNQLELWIPFLSLTIIELHKCH